jgi:hypothetical protein
VQLIISESAKGEEQLELCGASFLSTYGKRAILLATWSYPFLDHDRWFCYFPYFN